MSLKRVYFLLAQPKSLIEALMVENHNVPRKMISC